MAVVQWTSSSSGNWLTASDWSGGAVPGITDDVQIEVPNITVTFNSGTLAVASVTTIGSTLSVGGGSLTVSGVFDIGGAYLQSAGTFTLNGSLTTFGSTFSQTGGALDVDNGLLLSEGAFSEAGGTLALGGQGGTFTSAFGQSAGTISLTGSELTADQGFAQTGGSLNLYSNALLYGSTAQSSGATITEFGGLITDNGSFSENGGLLYLKSSGAVFNGAITVASGEIFESNGQFTSNQSLALSGGTVILDGNGGIFYGSVDQTGGTLALDNGQIYSYGSYVENGGLLELGYAGGTFNTLSVESGQISSTAAVLEVGGLFSQTGGTVSFLGRDTILSGPFSQSSSGSIVVESGALELEGNGTLAGTISGTGKILVASGSTTIASTAVISLPSIEVSGGTLTFGVGEALKENFLLLPAAQLATSGKVLTLDEASTLDGALVGASTVVMAGGGVLNGMTLEGTSRLDLTSTVSETGFISMSSQIGARTVFDIEASGKLHITGNFGFTDQSQNGELLIAGSLIKSGGSELATVDTNVTSTGSINIAVGTLDFEGPEGSFAGTISGPGTFAISGGQNSFSASLSLASDRFILEQGNEQLTLTHNLSYGGEWSQLGGTLWLDGTNVTVTTGGPTGLDGGMVTGSGTLSAAKIAPVNISGIDFEGTSTLDVAGVVDQTSNVSFGAEFGSAPILEMASGATWIVENNASLGGQLNSPLDENGTFINDGTFEKLNGAANSFVAGDFINNGTLILANSELTLNGSGTLGGTVTGSGVLNLQGDYTLATGVIATIAEIDTLAGTTTLSSSLSYSNIWAQGGSSEVYLDGNTLSVSGLVSLEGGSLVGPGTMVTSSTTVLGDNYDISVGTLVINAHADQVGDLTIGDFTAISGPPQGGVLPPSLATLEISSGATYYLDDSSNISSNGTLAVAGTLSALGGAQSVIGPSVIDTGAILAHSAALRFLGPVSGTGSIVVGNGGSLDFAGSVASSVTVSFTTATGSMFLEDPFPNTSILTFDASVAGFQKGDFIELSNLSQNPSQVQLTLNASGKVATLTDTNGDSDNITFTAAQSLSSLTVAIGPHGDITLFHT